MPPRALSRNVHCCGMEMLYFATFGAVRSETARPDIIPEADKLHDHVPFLGPTDRAFLRSRRSGTEKFSCTCTLSYGPRSSLRNSPSHASAHFQPSPANTPIPLLSRHART